ncbi:CDP-alcohol phosphatidyltransferase family protein [Candidatus Bathyarchaeota archaeon]|nr:CDP-alcohol phosphatidyltransferase family protein [Candidatus Bathyarchaeota archaeon]
MEVKRFRYLPLIISIARLVTLPFLVLALWYGLVFVADALFLFAVATDFADGYVAKKLHLASKFGAYFDAIADFLFIFGVFAYFVASGFYSVWILVLVAFEFAQFLLTSHFSQVVYDPIGKYYGSLLYGAVGLTLLFSGDPIYTIVSVGVLIATAASLLSRLIYFVRVYTSKKR